MREDWPVHERPNPNTYIDNPRNQPKVHKRPVATANLKECIVTEFIKEINFKRRQANLPEMFIKRAIQFGTWIMLLIRDRNFVIVYDTTSNTFDEQQRFIHADINEVVLDAQLGPFGDIPNVNFCAISYIKFNEIALHLRPANQLLRFNNPSGLCIRQLQFCEPGNFRRLAHRSFADVILAFIRVNLR